MTDHSCESRAGVLTTYQVSLLVLVCGQGVVTVLQRVDAVTPADAARLAQQSVLVTVSGVVAAGDGRGPG